MSDNKITLPDGLDVETATDVLREYANVDEAQIVATDTLESLRNELDEFKSIFAEVAAEDSPHSADVLADLDAEALTEPFRTEDGDVDLDTLWQEPETGDVSGDSGGGGDGDGMDLDSLSPSTLNEIRETTIPKINSYEQRGMEQSVERLKTGVLEQTGGEDFDAVKAELEAL